MNRKLQEMINLVPVIKNMTNTDAVICVWDKEGVVQGFFKSEEVELDFPIGFKAKDENDPLYEAIRTKKVIYNKVPKEVFGVAIEGTITPIFDEDEVVGVVTYVFSSEIKNGIESNINKLMDSVADTNKSIEDISAGSKNLKNNMNNIQSITEVVNSKLQEALDVVKEIQQNAKLSNILALNASIESARAGEAGRGFSIVSDEMRKFSNMSKEASEKINNTLNDITKALNDAKESVNESAIITGNQAEAVNRLGNIFDEVSNTAEAVIASCKEANNI